MEGFVADGLEEADGQFEGQAEALHGAVPDDSVDLPECGSHIDVGDLVQHAEAVEQLALGVWVLDSRSEEAAGAF